MCFSFKNSGKIKRSLQGSSVENTHKKQMKCSECGCLLQKKSKKMLFKKWNLHAMIRRESQKKKKIEKKPNFFFCFGEGGRYRYSSIRSFALTLSTPMNRVNKNFEKND